MKNHFVVTLEIETALAENELCIAHDDSLGIADGDTEITGFIAISRLHISKKASPEMNWKGLKNTLKKHAEQIVNNVLKND